MNKKIILLSSLAIFGILFLGQTVLAVNSNLLIYPATGSKNVGTTFNVAVKIDSQGNKVCVVRGTLNFDNLACQNIKISNGLLAQKTPTCTNPSFIIGIPKCTTDSQNIISVSVKGIESGQANISVVDAKVIGAGTNISSNLQGGTYNITVAKIEATPETKITNTTNEQSQDTENSVEQITSENNIPTNMGTASLATMGSKWFNYFAIALIILIVAYGIYYFLKKRKTK